MSAEDLMEVKPRFTHQAAPQQAAVAQVAQQAAPVDYMPFVLIGCGALFVIMMAFLTYYFFCRKSDAETLKANPAEPEAKTAAPDPPPKTPDPAPKKPKKPELTKEELRGMQERAQKAKEQIAKGKEEPVPQETKSNEEISQYLAD